MLKKNIYILAVSMGSGGAEKVISLLLPFLQLKYSVTLVLLHHNIHFPIPDNVKLVLINNKKSLSFFDKIFLFPKAIYQYVKLLKQNKVNVSISLLTRPNLINGIAKIFSPQTKVIISERCYPSKAYKSNQWRYMLYQWLIPLVYNKADVLFSNSIHINEDLRKNFGLKIPSHVIYNPINLQEQDIKKENTSGNFFNLVSVGSIYPIKNQELTVKALAKCSIPYQMVFVGDGVSRSKVESLCIEAAIAKHVEFVGKVNDVNQYLKQSDCFILSSNSEGFPNVILEAMAMGLPIISTNCLSGPLEILNENIPVQIAPTEFVVVKYGILVNVNDATALANAITYLAGNLSLRTTLSELSLARAKHYKTEIIVEKLMELIN